MRQTLVKGLFNMPAPPLPSGRRHECFGLKIKASSTHRHGLRVQTFSHWTVLIIRIKSLLEMCRRKNRRVWAPSVFYNSSESKAAKRWTARRMWTRPHITLDCDFSLFICIFMCVGGREMGSNFSNRCCNINKKKNRNDCEPSCLFVILHQQWRGHTIPSFTGKTPGNEHIVNINI